MTKRPNLRDDELSLVAVSAAIGNPMRYSILKALRDNTIVSCCDRLEEAESGACVLDVMKATGLAQATVSQHLNVLEKAGLIRKEKREPYTVFFAVPRTIETYLETLRSSLM